MITSSREYLSPVDVDEQLCGPRHLSLSAGKRQVASGHNVTIVLCEILLSFLSDVFPEMSKNDLSSKQSFSERPLLTVVAQLNLEHWKQMYEGKHLKI